MAHRTRYGHAALSLAAAAILALAATGSPAAQPCPHAAALDAAARQQWHRAQRLARAACCENTDAGPEELASLLQTCQLQMRLEQRYRDGSLADWMHKLEHNQGRDLVECLCSRVASRALQPPEPASWTARALDIFAAAANNSLVRSQWNLSDAQAGALCKWLGELAQATPSSPELLLESLEEFAARENLPAGWPGVNLAAVLAEGLDEYSHLLGPRETDRFYARLGGAYVGIGVDLRFSEAWPRVFDVIEDSPAAAAGLRPGDLLVAVADEPLRDLTEARVAQLLAGPPGQSLCLTLRRPRQDLTVQLTRRGLTAASVRQARLLDSTAGLAAVRIAAFDRDTAMELCRAVEDLREQGARQLIIDLRCNGGGMLSSAIDAARLFVDRGVIVTVESHTTDRAYHAHDEARFDMPVFLLVDESTASAAEIFAAALRHHCRARIIGRQTRGKGLVQTVAPLENTPVALCLTTARYLDPAGRCLHREGIRPDLAVQAAARTSVAGWLTNDDPWFRVVLAALASRDETRLVHAR